jgi:N-acetylmuramoyl-L-alanine amidase
VALLSTACSAQSATSANPPTVVSGNSKIVKTGKTGKTPAPAPAKPGASIKGKTIVLDPGHNGGKVLGYQVKIGNGSKACDTSGTATDAGYTEHASTWAVANRLKKLLVAQGAKVVLTRDSDTGRGPCVTGRAAIGNKAHADAAISIHADGTETTSPHGFHVIEPKLVPGFNDGIIAPSKKLGTDVRDAYKAGTGIVYSTYTGNEGVTVRDDLGGLNLSRVPKIFIETGNMKNPQDAAKLSSGSFRQRIAVALAAGLTHYLRP